MFDSYRAARRSIGRCFTRGGFIRRLVTTLPLLCSPLLSSPLLHAAPLLSDPAAGITVSWQAPTENTDGTLLTDLAGFRIYGGADPSNLTVQASVMNPSIDRYVIESLSAGIWYFAVTAVDASGNESNLSEVASVDLGSGQGPGPLPLPVRPPRGGPIYR
ncbi:MAG TPA: fibronectin type III domain-containing protein [Steroidobacteraceae bacterium]|nr:fibronectin type III domain-containing protein [Steroidobacteraceae bacterium]